MLQNRCNAQNVVGSPFPPTKIVTNFQFQLITFAVLTKLVILGINHLKYLLLVKIRLHTKNQLPGLPASALKFVLVGWVVVVVVQPITLSTPTRVEVELG